MKYIPLKNTLLKGWAKKDGMMYCLTQTLYKNTRNDGIKHSMIIDRFYQAQFVKRNRIEMEYQSYIIFMSKAGLHINIMKKGFYCMYLMSRCSETLGLFKLLILEKWKQQNIERVLKKKQPQTKQNWIHAERKKKLFSLQR